MPIVKKTAKLIYYTSDSWDRREAVVSPGCISREQFETDTRCHDDRSTAGTGRRCRHGYPAGVIPVPGDRHRPAVQVVFGGLAGGEEQPGQPAGAGRSPGTGITPAG